MNIHKGLPTVPVTKDTIVSLDIEIFGQTKGKLHRPTGEFACLSVGIGEDVFVIQDKNDLVELFSRIAPAKYFVLHQSLYDIRQLRRWIKFDRRLVWDSLLMDKTLWGGYYNIQEFSLGDLTRRYLDVKLDKEIRAEFEGSVSMSDEMLEYAAKDAYYTLRVQEAQQKEIDTRGDTMNTYWTIDEPAIWAILDLQPVKIDVPQWISMAKEFERRGVEMERDMGVNVYSHVQVKEYIRKTTGLKLDSTAAEVLEDAKTKVSVSKIKETTEIIDKITLIRMLRKASSTYGLKWVDNNVEEDGMVYSDFYVIGAESGRMTSSNPNLQQIPSRRIPEYRQLFISKYGKMIVADIQAQEPRILAYLSGDKHLREAFENKEDVHLTVTRAIFKDETIQKSDKRREVGKMINLATSYGMTAQGLAGRLGIPEEQAEDFLRQYFTRFSGVTAYIDKMRSIANRFEYVETISGRRIWMNRHSFQSANNAINAPIQGSAADLLKLWMVDFWNWCKYENIMYPVVMPIHDELVLDSPIELVAKYKQGLIDTLNSSAGKLFGDMPFTLDIKSGRSWACKKETDE
jgi:DNA polymerase I